MLHINNFPDYICSQVWYSELLKECKGCWNLFCAGLYFRNLKFCRLLLKFQTFWKEMGKKTFFCLLNILFLIKFVSNIKYDYTYLKLKVKTSKQLFFIFLSRISLIWNPLLTTLKVETVWRKVKICFKFMPFSKI